MNHFKIEVPEDKTLEHGKITLNGVELTRVVKINIAAYPHMPMPVVNITLRAEVVEIVNTEVVTEEEEPVAYVPPEVANRIISQEELDEYD